MKLIKLITFKFLLVGPAQSFANDWAGGTLNHSPSAQVQGKYHCGRAMKFYERNDNINDSRPEVELRSLQGIKYLHAEARKYFMVGLAGFEPTTSSSRTMRATNCATARCI